MTTKTPEPARIIPETEARIISQKLEFWDDGIGNFAMQASHDLRELQKKLRTPTRADLPAIHADIAALIENQRMIQGINAAYRSYLHELKDRFNRSFTILDVLKGDPGNVEE